MCIASAGVTVTLPAWFYLLAVALGKIGSVEGRGLALKSGLLGSDFTAPASASAAPAAPEPTSIFG